MHQATSLPQFCKAEHYQDMVRGAAMGPQLCLELIQISFANPVVRYAAADYLAEGKADEMYGKDTESKKVLDRLSRLLQRYEVDDIRDLPKHAKGRALALDAEWMQRFDNLKAMALRVVGFERPGGHSAQPAAHLQDVGSGRVQGDRAMRLLTRPKAQTSLFDQLRDSALLTPENAVDLTPELAEQLEVRKSPNRHLNQLRVGKYAEDMKHGKWRLSPDPIVVNSAGQVTNGQHRIAAVLESGVTIRAFVLFSLDETTNIDTGRKRSLADVLHMKGEARANQLSGAAHILWRYLNGKYNVNHIVVTHEQAIELIEDHPGLRDSVHYVWDARRLLPPSQSAVLHYLFKEKAPELADTFFGRLADGIELAADNPVYPLRERLTVEKGMAMIEKRAITILAWNKFCKGKKMRRLRWTAGAAFPEIEGPHTGPQNRAVTLLRELFAETRTLPVSDILNTALAQGISQDTVGRARRSLGIMIDPIGKVGDSYTWSAPEVWPE